MKGDLLTRYTGTKNFTAGYKVTDPFRAAGAVQVRLSLCALSSNSGFCLHKNLPVQQLLSAAPSGAVFEKVRVLSASRKEQAEVGQSPTLLAFCSAKRVLRILRGYFKAFPPAKEKKKGYPAVSCINR